MNTRIKTVVLLLATLALAVTFWSCATMGKAGSSAKIAVTPDKTVLSP